MNLDMQLKLKKLLIQHEGCRSEPYSDTKGNITIGIGRNLTDRGVLPSEIDFMYNNDALYFFEQLSADYKWFNYLDENRQIALVDFAFCGMKTFAEFTSMIAALTIHDFDSAADELLNSVYAKQVGQRAIDLANIIRTGDL